MLDRLLRRHRRPRLRLKFEQRECVIVPQTPSRIALHADVYFAAMSVPGPSVIEDAHLVWESPAGVFRTSRWDRAVIDGRFRYPPEPLAVTVGASVRPVTLTFNDPLIPHDDSPPPRRSTLALEMVVSGVSLVRRRLWALELEAWDVPTDIRWLGGDG